MLADPPAHPSTRAQHPRSADIGGALRRAAAAAIAGNMALDEAALTDALATAVSMVGAAVEAATSAVGMANASQQLWENTSRSQQEMQLLLQRQLLQQVEILEQPLKLTGTAQENADAVASALIEEGWRLLDEADPQRGQAVASSDEILINQADEFAAGFIAANKDKGGDIRLIKSPRSCGYAAYFYEVTHEAGRLCVLCRDWERKKIFSGSLVEFGEWARAYAEAY